MLVNKAPLTTYPCDCSFTNVGSCGPSLLEDVVLFIEESKDKGPLVNFEGLLVRILGERAMGICSWDSMGGAASGPSKFVRV